MGKISEIFNFNDIGGKIKGLAKWSCWITILLLWIATPILIIVAIAEGGDDAFVAVILFPIAAVIASFAIWVGSWAMYAFGEFVEDTHAMRNKEGTTKEVTAKRDAEAKAKRKAEEKAKREADEKAAKLAAEKEQLSISDIESAASAFLNRLVSISEITCTLIYVISKSTGIPKEMHLGMSVGDTEFTSLDLFFDQQRKSYFFKGKQLALDDAWRSEEEIFEFNVSKFKEFNTEVDEDE